MIRFFKAPVLRLAIPYAIIVTILCLYVFSDTVVPVFELVPLVVLGILLVGVPIWILVWAIRLTWWLRKRRRGKATKINRPTLAWSIEPLVTIILIGLVASDALFHLRFSISRPFLEDAATKYLDQYPRNADSKIFYPEAPKYIGLFRAHNVKLLGEECVIFVTAYGGRDGGELVYYLGEGEPPVPHVPYYRRIDGRWWRGDMDY
ncbi:MAG: hypothetical protein QM496_04800 [Verrucomicrobiota bacterium]